MAENEKLRIEYIRLDKAIELLWPENPKMHHLQALAKSFETHGFRDAPAFDEKLAEGGAIVDGNGRIEALWWMYNESQTNDEVKPPRGIALDDGMWCLPVQFGINAASKAAAESYALDANNLTLLGGEFTAFDIARMYDQDAYLAVLAEAAAANVMPASVDLEDLEALYRGFGAETPVVAPEPQLDKAAELQEIWQVRRGQIWECGEHRIACGDCTEGVFVKRILRDETVAVITDPPYGIPIMTDYGFGKRGTRAVDGMTFSPIHGNEEEFDPSFLLNSFDFCLLWGANHYAHRLPHIGRWLIWDKREDKIPERTQADCELAWCSEYGAARIFRHYWDGMLKASERGEKRQHPTQKPVALFEWCISFAPSNLNIYDPFLGSGTTIIACQRLSRGCKGIEIEPKYIAVSLQRLADMGLEPHLVDEITQ